MTETRKKLLWVDDEADKLHSWRAGLAEFGVDVVFASNYVEAFEKIQETKFDAMILDVVLPKYPGDDAGGSVNIGASRDTAIDFQETNPGKPIMLESTYAEAKIKEFGLDGLFCAPRHVTAIDKINFILGKLGLETIEPLESPENTVANNPEPTNSGHFKTVRNIRNSALTDYPYDDPDAKRSR